MSQGYTPSLGDDPDRMAGSCRGKVRHSSKAVAKSVIKRIIDSGQAYYPEALNAYKCKLCKGGWHVGHDYRRLGRLTEE